MKIETKNNPKTCLKFELSINFVFTLERGTSFWSGVKSYWSNFCKNSLRFCFFGNKGAVKLLLRRLQAEQLHEIDKNFSFT